jgi:hypothetical protein
VFHHAELKFVPSVLVENVVAIGVVDAEEKSGLVPMAHAKVILAGPLNAWATTTLMLPPSVLPATTFKRVVEGVAMMFPEPATPHLTVLPFHTFGLLPGVKPRMPTVVVDDAEKGEDDDVIWKCADATCGNRALREGGIRVST